MLQGIYVIKIIYRGSDINIARAKEAFKSILFAKCHLAFQGSF
jgi:hypothetical protein